MYNYQYPVLLSGIGGMGKSELMNYWVRKAYKREIDHVAFQSVIHIDCSIDIETGFITNYSVLNQLGLSDLPQSNRHNKLEVVVDSLNQLDELLLVLDNLPWQDKVIDKCASQLEQLSTLSCRIIATSRSKEYEFFKEIHVGVLSEKQCVELFLTYNSHSKKYVEEIKEIIGMAGNHTLSIELLSKTAYRNQYNPDKLLMILKDNQFHINTEVRYKKDSIRVKESIDTALGKLFSLSVLNNQQQKILYHFSLMEGHEIAFDLLTEWLGVDVIEDNSVLTDLLMSGWLQIAISSNDVENATEVKLYKLHEVVSHAIRSKFRNIYINDERIQFLEHVTVRMEKYYTNLDTYKNSELATIKKMEELDKICLPAVSTYLRFSVCLTEHTVALEKFVHRMNDFAIFCQHQGFYEISEDMLVKSLKHISNHLGESDFYYGSTIGNIANIKMNIQDFETAYPLLEQVVSIVELQLDGSFKIDDIYAKVLNNLAYYHKVKGNLTKAENLYRKTLNIRKLYKRYDIEYISILNNLGGLYESDKNYNEAVKYLNEAKSLIEKLLGNQNIYYSHTISNLGKVYLETGKYHEAIELFSTALNIRGKKLGKNCIEYAYSLHNLSLGYGLINKFEKSIDLCLDAINIAEHILVEDAPMLQVMRRDYILFKTILGQI